MKESKSKFIAALSVLITVVLISNLYPPSWPYWIKLLAYAGGGVLVVLVFKAVKAALSKYN